MKKIRFKVPYYDFDVELIQVESKDDADAVVKEMRWAQCDKDDIDEEHDAIVKDDGFNGGTTYRNFQLKIILVLFYKFRSQRMKNNVYGHEKRHVEDRILEWANVKDIEASAFLAGFLSEKFDAFKEMTQNNKS